MKYGRDLSAPAALAAMEMAVQYELLLPKLSLTANSTGNCVQPISSPVRRRGAGRVNEEGTGERVGGRRRGKEKWEWVRQIKKRGREERGEGGWNMEKEMTLKFTCGEILLNTVRVEAVIPNLVTHKFNEHQSRHVPAHMGGQLICCRRPVPDEDTW